MTDTYENQYQTAGDSAERSRNDEPEMAEHLREPLAGQSGGGLPLETVFDILKNERRQQVLGYLAVTGDDVVNIGELAEHVAAIENDVAVDALSSQQRKRVYVGLYQCHLPKMGDSDVIEFDKDRGTIRMGPNADQVTPYLDLQTDDDDVGPAPVRRSLAVFATTCLIAYLLAASLAESGVVLGGATILAGFAVGTVLEYQDRNRTE